MLEEFVSSTSRGSNDEDEEGDDDINVDEGSDGVPRNLRYDPVRIDIRTD